MFLSKFWRTEHWSRKYSKSKMLKGFFLPKYYPILFRGLEIFKILGFLSLGFSGRGFCGGGDFCSYDGISHQKATRECKLIILYAP